MPGDEQSLLAQFRAAASAGTISDATIAGVSVVLVPLGLTSLAIANGNAEPSGADVVLRATATFSNLAWDVTLTGTPGGPTTAFALQLLASTRPWTFGAAFPALPQSRYAAPRAPVVELVDSVLAPLVVDEATIVVRSADPVPRFSGWLVLEGSRLEQYEYFLGGGAPVSRLWCSGELRFVDRPAGNPLLSLRAVAPAIDLGIGSLTDVGVDQTGLELSNDVPDQMALGEEPAPATSAVELFALLTIGRVPPLITGTVSATLLQADFVWTLRVRFDDPPRLSHGVAAIVSLFNGTPPSALAIPPGLAALDVFGIDAIDIGVIPTAESYVPDLDTIAITLVSTTAWNPPVPFIQITQVGTRWTYQPSSQALSVFGSVWGLLTLTTPGGTPIVQSNGELVQLLVTVALPALDIAASTQTPIVLPLGDAFGAYFTGAKPEVPATLTVEQIGIEASLTTKTYRSYFRAFGDWVIPIGAVDFSLEELYFEMVVTPNAVSALLNGRLALSIQGRAPALFEANARYPGEGTWEFACELYTSDPDESIDVIQFVMAFFGSPPSADLPVSLEITELRATYSTATGNPFSARATVIGRWDAQDLIGLTLSLKASVDLRRQAATSGTALALRGAVPTDGEMIYVGSISGTFEVNRLAITAGLSFFDSENTYLLRVMYREVGIEAATAYRTTNENRHQVITFRLLGVTLGSIVEYFVSLANPNLNYVLQPPWTFLNSIDLSAITLTIDPTDQTIELTYRVGLSLPFMRVDTVGIVYDRSSGEPTVDFVLTGQFLDRAYTPEKPLRWDAVNDAPPAVPGAGSQLVDLRYLGFGQHVTLTGLVNYESVNDVLAALREQMQPVEQPDVNPLEQPSGDDLRFDENSRWMIGADVTLMGTVSLGLILHDPDLYGIVIALAGPDAGGLAGLSFELLYKKVSDDVGVFHVRLQVPDAFRQLQFGAVAITLGIITVDIFTNGNFLIDLGFPHNRNFDLSFGLQAGIFIGRGGIYFGLLNGTTSKRVPKITNGSFDPVLELGIGFAVGVGRTFEKGPLKAGLYVELEVLFEGVLAWFHPTDAGAPTAMYYWCRGSAALVGKLYGSVDFKVIKVAVSVEAHAAVTLTMAAYEATLVELDVGVEVHAELTILFISVSFSFSLQLRADFTIGERSTPPWILAPGQSGGGATTARLHSSAHATRRRHTRDVARLTRTPQRLAALLAGDDPCAAYALHWDPAAKVFPGGATPQGGVFIAPVFTIADVPVAWSGTPPPNDDPAYAIAFALFAEGATPAQAGSIRETHRQTADHSTLADDPSGVAFNLLIEAMMRWSIDALGIDPLTGAITLGELNELAEQLDCPQTQSTGFTFANLDTFLGNNLRLLVSSAPADAALQPGVLFPMIPQVQWTAQGVPPPADQRSFTDYQPIDAIYEAEVSAYFAKIEPTGAAQDGVAAASADLDETVESMATFLFRDYFLLIAKAATQAALDVMARFPQTVSASDSLRLLADAYGTIEVPYTVSAGDTVEQVAAAVGYGTVELLLLNPTLPSELAAAAPGEVITLTLGVTPESIAAANPDWGLTAQPAVPLGDLAVQVAQDETLTALAQRMGIDPGAWLATPALLATENLLRGGASLTLTNFSYANTGALALPLVAALVFVRLGLGGPPLTLPLADWYAQAIVQLNGETIGADGSLPATVLVPPSYNVLAPAVSWTTLPGDTLESVAATFALQQNPVAEADFAAYLAAVQQLNPNPGATVVLPDATILVLAAETLGTLARRLLLDLTVPAQATTFATLVSGANVLAPRAVVLAPAVVATTTASDTLLTLAQRYGLSLEELGTRIAGQTGLLAASTELVLLAVPNVPTLGVDALVAQLTSGAPASTIAGQVSRFLFSGLRVPAPVLGTDGHYHATGALTGLYALTGQQVVGPAPDSTLPPTDVRVQLDITATPASPWIVFSDAAVVAVQEDRPLLAARHAQFDALNPALRLPGRLRAGQVVRTALAGQLTVAITEEELAEGYPALTLVPDVLTPLRAMPLGRETPVRHGLAQTIPWQAAAGVTLPHDPADAAVAGTPSVWPFPADLLAQAARDRTTPFELDQVDPQAGPDATPTELPAYAWATTVSLAIRRISGRPSTYELIGADTAGRQLLLEVVTYLESAPEGESATLQLLYALSPGAGMPPGLSSDAIIPNRTYLVKGNVSTETHSGLRARARALGDDALLVAAAIDEPLAFTTLAWQCSVIGGGGFWLDYRTTDGKSLPEAIFAADGTAELTLVVQLTSQTTWNPPAQPVRRLYSFNNVALVGPGIDPASVALFARAADASETTLIATVTPGNVGFALDLVKTPTGPQADAQDQLRARYNLVGYQLTATTAFGASEPAMPVGPQTKRPESGALDAPSDENVWHLAQVLPVHRYALARTLPAIPGLPPPADDPYAGINGAGTPLDPVLATTGVRLWFQDVLGNVSASANDAAVSIDVGYTDPVVGVGSWPATTTGYVVTAASVGATLSVTLSAQAAGVLPSYAQLGNGANADAAIQRDRFAQVYWQVMQPDVTAALFTTLEADPGEIVRDLPAISIVPLQQYVAAGCAWSGTLATLASVAVDAVAAPTLDDALTVYGIDYEALGNANAGAVLGDLVVATTIAVPHVVPFADGATVAQLCAPLDPVTVLSDEDNLVLPLRTGVELTIPQRTVTVTGVPTLDALTQAERCTIATLVAANAARPSLLQPGFVFTCEGVQVMVGLEPPFSDATLDGVASAFAAAGVPFDATMVAGANAVLPGMFREGAALWVRGYVVVAGDTLAVNGSGASTSALVAANTTTPDLFFSGAPLFLEATSDATQLHATLANAARTYAISPGDLLRANGTLAPGSALGVPGHAAIPPAARVPYRIAEGDALSTIAARFAGADGTNPALALATPNENVPGTVAADVSITVDGSTVTTTQPSSFAQVEALFSPAIDLAQLVAAIATDDGVLAAGAQLYCPAAQLGATASTFVAAAARYGVTPAQLANANAATDALLVANVTLAPKPGTATPTLTTASDDSLVSLVRRFALAGVVTTPAEIAAANPTAPVLRASALLLLPPPDATVATQLGASGWHFPAATFPIHVQLQIARERTVVAPEFRGPDAAPGQAVRDRAAIPAQRDPSASDGLTLDAFATAMQGAIEGLRVATGRVLAEEREVGGTDVWAVLFMSGFISAVTVTPPLTVPGVSGPQPRSYAIRPLATSLIARDDVTIEAYDPLTGQLTGEGRQLTFQGVDLEAWARAFLADVELLASAQYAAPAYRANADALTDAIAAKQQLASAVANGLAPVLDGQEPSADAIVSAQRALTQSLLVNLTNGYATAAMFQYDATVSSPWQTDLARLSGTATQRGDLAPGDAQRSAGIAGAKTSLASGTSYVNFALSLAEAGAERNVPMHLRYALGELEFDVAPIDGYAASDWLSFVQPLDQDPPDAVDVDLGDPVIPIPLRAYPPLPALSSQAAEFVASRDLDAALRWTYAFTYVHQSAAQDQPHLQVEFNLPPPPTSFAAATLDDDLFSALAQYAHVAGALWGTLSVLPDLPDEVPPNVAHAVQTFADLAARVAGQWTTYWSGGASAKAALPQGELYEFAVTLNALEAGVPAQWWYDTLVLTRVEGEAIAWPEITCTTPAGVTVELDHPEPDGDEPTMTYTFPPSTVPAFVALAFTYRFGGLHVADYQNATSRVWVVRNEQLLGEDGPATQAAFVYRTPALAFPQPVVPLLESDEPIGIGPWSASDNPLVPVFDAIFDGDAVDRLVSVGINYAYDLVPPTLDSPAIETVLPVALQPKFTYTPTTPAEIADFVDEWFGIALPAVDGGKWAFAISMYSALDPHLDRPILRLTRLLSPLDAAAIRAGRAAAGR